MLPDDFYMADDVFLKLVCAEDTKVVETSRHPYALDEKLDGVIHGTFFCTFCLALFLLETNSNTTCVFNTVPHAESLTVRFDRRSATSFGYGLLLESSSGPVETLQGNFGSCVVRAPG